MLFRIVRGVSVAVVCACLSLGVRGEEGLEEYRENSLAEYHKYKDVLRNDKLVGGWSGGRFVFGWEDEEGEKEYFSMTPEGEKVRVSAKEFAKLNKAESKSKSGGKGKKKGRGGERSPDGKWRVGVDEGKLFLEETGRGKGRGKKLLMEVDAEKMKFGKVLWAPDSMKFVISRVTRGQERMVTIVESAPEDGLQPKLHEFRYDKPGDVIDVAEPVVFYVDGGEAFVADESLLVNPYEVGDYEWRDGRFFTYEFIERGFGKQHVILADVEERSHRVLIREDSDTYVYAFHTYRHDVAGGKEIIWSSERDGWNHLYLYDGVTGEVKNQITKGEMTVHDVEYVDEDKRRILFTAGGEVEGVDPYYKQWYWVNFDGSGLRRITDGKWNHGLEFSEDYAYAVDTLKGVDRAAGYQMIDGVTGKVLADVGSCDLSGLEAKGWQKPEAFVSKDRDGRFEIWGTIYWPKGFDPGKSYPVIESIYAGPHGQHVPKELRVWMAGIHELTMRGFIVVKIDGKGTHQRCREFSHFCYKNLVDAGLPDRIKWIKEAAEKYPQMDVARVGIFGGSAGGQSSTGAVLLHGDFYKAAFSDCGCHDNRMDKIWWNEQWMDWPVGPHYAEQSNATHAAKLSGKLFLNVGEMDTNVDPASTMQLADALLKAGKDFELLVMPGKGHGCAESSYGRWKRAGFFLDSLGLPE
ncbi:MAG: prolyl oligopeptidase family serine peptidase [Akkermansiaceae bacterium]